MRIGIFLSSLGGSPLQGGIERGLAELGHEVCCYSPGATYDLLLIFNQCAHVTNYEYPPFPTYENKTPVAFVDSAEYGWTKRQPHTIEDYWNAFAPGSLSHDTKNSHEQKRLHTFIAGRSFPYFIREYDKRIDFPAAYHPIDYPLYYQSVEVRPPNREEYLRRAMDLYVSWGASHPWRLPLTDELRAVSCRSDINVIEQNGHERTPQFGPDGYFEKMRGAKCSVSFDGYGSGSFRITEALVRCVLLQGPMTMRTREPLIDGQTCVEYRVAGWGMEFGSTDIAEKLKEVLADPERSYRIYEAGYNHCNEQYSERATAQYVLNTVRAHDYSRATIL